MARYATASIGKQSRESVESVLKKKSKATLGRKGNALYSIGRIFTGVVCGSFS